MKMSDQTARSTIKVVLLSVSVLLFVLGLATALPVRADVAMQGPHAPDRLLVKFRPGVPVEKMAGIHAEREGVVLREMRRLGVQVVQVPAQRLEELLAAYNADPDVLYAEPDYIAQGTFDPDDPYYQNDTQWGPRKIKANLAWDVTRGSSSVVVAIVDSGIDPNHPDLSGKLTSGYDFVNDDNDPRDDNGHGTHVAGIAGAVTNNATGVAGVGYRTDLMPVKVLNQGNGGYYSDVADGIVYAVDHGARVINLSLGGTSPSSVLYDAVEYAWGRGALLVAAAGNNGNSDPFYPASYEHVMGVSATTSSDVRWSLSNYGSYISVAAPGQSVYSTSWDATNGSGYRYRSGTSMAAPHVSGVAALVLAVDPGLTNVEVWQIIEETADDLGAPGWDEEFGWGLVDAQEAVQVSKQNLKPTAVTLASFTATWQDDAVVIEWETASEINNIGFNVWRALHSSGPYRQVNESIIPAQGLGSVTGASYSFVDEDVMVGATYYYRLESVAADGTSERSYTAVAQPDSEPDVAAPPPPPPRRSGDPKGNGIAKA